MEPTGVDGELDVLALARPRDGIERGDETGLTLARADADVLDGNLLRGLVDGAFIDLEDEN